MTTVQRLGRRAALVMALVAQTACGGGSVQVAGGPRSAQASAYEKKCNFNAGKQRFELAQNNYTPLSLSVAQWPGHAETVLTEAQLVAVLAKGDVKRASIFARGGLGKTRLEAFQASARGGRLSCELRGDRVRIAGRAALYLRGTIFV